MDIRTKRAYDKPAGRDGCRILVDRIWPRGVSKETARIDKWLKEVAPSTNLRKWFGHDPEKWTEFKKRYYVELKDNQAVDDILQTARERPVTLVYAAKDQEHNNAVALKEYLEKRGR